MRKRSFIMLAVVYGALLFAAGCQQFAPDATQRITISTQDATAVLNGLASARDEGLVTQATLDKYKPVVDAFAAAKAVAEKDLKAGDVSGYNSAIQQLQAAYIQLRPLLAQTVPVVPATKP